ncbi:MAG: DUF3311 domain-containing protein [Polyangiaceae bacterium]|jgi:Protein of unknown function (DUF3311)
MGARDPDAANATDPATDPASVRRARGRAWRLLLLVPFVATLWVPFYDSLEPRIGGVPYFYWYQFLWIGIGALITAVVYFATRRTEP